MNYVIILAGGVGSRFWPLSSSSEPKQFLNLYSGRSMIEETIDRIGGLFKKENIYIATNKLYSQKIRKVALSNGLQKKNILFEPQGRNTFAPIGILSDKINRIDPDAIITVLPCDHIISERKVFLKLLKQAQDYARQGEIVTLGIPPDRPETGYGYIRIKSFKKEIRSKEIKGYRGDKFVEKPSLEAAKKLIKDKRYYWNAGIFIFKSSVMMYEIMHFLPQAHKIIESINSKNNLKKLWHKLPAVSIDYAIMEKTKRIIVLIADCGWKDLGSLQAMSEILKKDRNGNIFMGNCVDIGSTNTFVWSENKVVGTLGLKNMIVIETRDAVLICPKVRAQEVKKLVQLLGRRSFKK
ncbi:MAG: sugar phosphate nucleotidyltransferase [Candidatus Omnitrophica bacterium]|nr:sugar phosphate nucleotidyltransferase [Candidatus Omnitrophota bacterium]MDD5238157.1 sugar phosphate nucleotidyltransferase [Candidatus Omnitrophota bacterium]